MQQQDYDVIVIGGGLAGLCCALHLSQHNQSVLLIEKHAYPHHKVCGEYLSNETLPYLRSLGIDLKYHGAVNITRFEISSEAGKKIDSQLPLGGKGISRFCLDAILAEKLKTQARVLIDTVTLVDFDTDVFTITTRENRAFRAQFVVGAYGKRSGLDKKLNRSFSAKRTPWMAVKSHYEYDFPSNTVALHNFEGGYCGLSKVETGAVNACYLTTNRAFNRCDSIDQFQREVMSRNPKLNQFFLEARPMFKKPLTISQISFAKKSAVEDHVFMLGDSAGLIHPLCGNGMAMAIHSAKLFSELFLKANQRKHYDRASLERAYEESWQRHFASRLRTGSLIQKILLNQTASKAAFRAASLLPGVIPKVIKKTHGRAFV